MENGIFWEFEFLWNSPYSPEKWEKNDILCIRLSKKIFFCWKKFIYNLFFHVAFQRREWFMKNWTFNIAHFLSRITIISAISYFLTQTIFIFHEANRKIRHFEYSTLFCHSFIFCESHSKSKFLLQRKFRKWTEPGEISNLCPSLSYINIFDITGVSLVFIWFGKQIIFFKKIQKTFFK